MSALPPLAGHWTNWGYDKWWFGYVLGITDDGLHMHAGLLILFLGAWAMRRPPWNWRPWLLVVAIETLNEAHDMLAREYPTAEANWRASSHDWWMTLCWPTVILLVVPRLIRRFGAPAAADATD